MKSLVILQLKICVNSGKIGNSDPPIVAVALLTDRWRGRLFSYFVHDLHHLGSGVVQGGVLHDGQPLGSHALLPGQHPLVLLLNHDIWRVCTGKVYLARLAQTDPQHGGPWTSPSVHSKEETTRECIDVSTKAHIKPRQCQSFTI